MPRQPKPKALVVGQIWRRKDSDREVEILRLHDTSTLGRDPFYDITWKGHNFTGRGETFEDSFRRRHEFVKAPKK